MHRFDYLIEKIQQKDFESSPFKHLEINNFFSENDFREIITSDEIALKKVKSELISMSTKNGMLPLIKIRTSIMTRLKVLV